MANNHLLAMKENLSKELFGEHLSNAKSLGICIKCRQKALPRCTTDAGRREYEISGLCEVCFDGLFRTPLGEE
jgi:hypothetical protein